MQNFFSILWFGAIFFIIHLGFRVILNEIRIPTKYFNLTFFFKAVQSTKMLSHVLPMKKLVIQFLRESLADVGSFIQIVSVLE